MRFLIRFINRLKRKKTKEKKPVSLSDFISGDYTFQKKIFPFQMTRYFNMVMNGDEERLKSVKRSETDQTWEQVLNYLEEQANSITIFDDDEHREEKLAEKRDIFTLESLFRARIQYEQAGKTKGFSEYLRTKIHDYLPILTKKRDTYVADEGIGVFHSDSLERYKLDYLIREPEQALIAV